MTACSPHCPGPLRGASGATFAWSRPASAARAATAGRLASFSHCLLDGMAGICPKGSRDKSVLSAPPPGHRARARVLQEHLSKAL